jgi:hypothetical protein
MKKKLLFKLFIFAVIGAFVTVTSCKDYDDDISRLDADLTALKNSVLEQADLTALQTQLTASIAAVQTDLNAAKATLAALQGSAATQEDIDAAKAEVLGQVVKLETFNSYKEWVDGEIATLKADLANAATKAEVEALETLLFAEITQTKNELAAKIANLEAILEVVDGESGVIADIYSQLEDQLAEIEANKAAIEATQEDLQAKYDELNAAIEALKVRVTDLEEGLEALDAKVDAIKTATDAAIAALEDKLDAHISLIMNLFDHLDRRVTSLVFEADYSSADGTPQIVVRGLDEWIRTVNSATAQTWAVKEDGTIYKGVTILKYRVNPSNANLNDFEVSQLLNKVTLVRSTSDDYLILTDEATMEGGILSVPVLIGADVYNDYGDDVQTPPHGESEHNHHVALEVKILDNSNEDKFVASDYVKVNFDLETGRIALNETSKKADGTLLPTSITYATIAGSSYDEDIVLWNGKGFGGLADNPNFIINLNDYIYGVFGDPASMKMLDYGFDKHNFTFELVTIGTEGTDQSNNYVILDGTTGELKVKPASNGGINQAAVGRTPVILVKAVVDEKVHAVGFIKVLITDNYDNTPVEFEFTLEDYMLGCDSEYGLTDVDIAEIDFDQVFNHARIQLGKDAFFAEYSQHNLEVADVEIVTAPAGATAGILGDATDEHVQFGYAIDPETESVNLANYFEGWSANDAPAGTYKIKTTLKSNGYRPNVVITWNFEVTLPTISINANTTVLANGKIVVNPTILEQGAKTSTAYEALLNNAFMHQADEFIYTGLTEECEKYLTPYFVFTAAPAGYVIADNGTTLRLTNTSGPIAAVIEEDPLNDKKFYVRLNEDDAPNSGSWGNYAPLSEAAKGLVGKTVSVQPKGYINGATYNVIDLYNAFNVEFTYPLELNLPQDAVVYDQANNGMNTYSLDVFNPETILVDWFGSELNVTTVNGRALYDHYEVGMAPVAGSVTVDYTFAGYYFFTTPPTGTVQRSGYLGWWWPITTPTQTYTSPFEFDLENIKCNINTSGQIVEAINFDIPAGMELKFSAVEAGGSTTWVVDGQTIHTPSVFTFEWNNGAAGAIQNEFKIAVPVKVAHKWGELKGNLVITVKPGSGASE